MAKKKNGNGKKPKAKKKNGNGKKPKAKAPKPNGDAMPKPNGHAAEKVPVGALVVQPHGGALRNGGTNKGGPGRPPDYLRMRSRGLFEKWLDWGDGQATERPACEKCGRPVEPPNPEVMNQIGKTAGRFGFPMEDTVSRQWVRERLRLQSDRIADMLATIDAERVLSALSDLWYDP